ncbi:hypothetical protein JTE90_009460 [Oedothorax gibbosus]|uniref:Phorbol-ester/DAG-type domain-containing protein n=1 Tax=Oedothorax gibbosus TaxID=931172 RepID=A0AAV6VU26_9ARAC|nr:hypothetical protein JTE90_009460 [Oedothorax gibbosus]
MKECVSFFPIKFGRSLEVFCVVRRGIILEQKQENSTHSFRTKTFRKNQQCDICKLPIEYQGISCKSCKVSCHKECEMKKPINENTFTKSKWKHQEMVA